MQFARLDDVNTALFESIVKAGRTAPASEMVEIAVQRPISLVHVVDIGKFNSKFVQLSTIHYELGADTIVKKSKIRTVRSGSNSNHLPGQMNGTLFCCANSQRFGFRPVEG